MPVFWFAISLTGSANAWQAVLVFGILHLLLYPASNGYNSYFDKDKGSIGGLEHPPTTTKNLYWWSLLFDLSAVMLGLLISWQFSAMLLVYGLVSKAYSHPSIRLKAKPFLGWLSVGAMQGYFVFLMTVYGISDILFVDLFQYQWQFLAILSSALLMGSYPMTQIYQHEEDRQRGDITMSIQLGIRGTFLFTGVFFLFSNLGFLFYYYTTFGIIEAVLFQVALSPVVGYFFYWFWLTVKDPAQANFRRTMRLNLLSSLMLNVFFIGMWACKVIL